VNRRRHKTMGRVSSRDRKVDIRVPRESILIVCEGARTEPNYFLGFRVTPNIFDIRGLGNNTVSLVNRAIEIAENEGPFDQIWCVFDRDSFPAENFNQALRKAKDNNINVAYSNEAFELWYILHYDYLDAAITREQYIDRLEQILGKKYEKNSKEMYKVLLNKQQNAIRNAEKLLSTYDPVCPEKDKPSTTVHLLVILLNQYKN
jgi:hypothetical protein